MRACEMQIPKTLDALADCLRDAPAHTRLLGGGTDLTIQRKEGLTEPALLIDLFGIPALHEITIDQAFVHLGAACTFTELENHPAIKDRLPALWQAASGVGSKQIRNRGTIGGNLANASPAGDVIPVLLALNASVTVLNGARDQKCLTILELVQGPSKTALLPDEAIVQISVPLPGPMRTSAFVKLGARARVTIAKISVAIALSEENGTICNAAVALGAVGERAFLSATAARLLEGGRLEQALFSRLGDVLSQEIAASIPNRASMPYKRQAVRGLAEDLWRALAKQHAGGTAQLGDTVPV